MIVANASFQASATGLLAERETRRAWISVIQSLFLLVDVCWLLFHCEEELENCETDGVSMSKLKSFGEYVF